MRHIYVFIGTTAELIKVAPVIKELKSRRRKFKIVTTGQNDINFSEFEWYLGKIKPDISIGKKNKRSSVWFFIEWTIKTFFKSIYILDKEFSKKNKQDILLIVHGDTVSSLIGALVGKLLGVKIAHIESGLRSFNYLEPFPEEISRVIISRLADIHFCPNKWACSNIKNISGKKINTKQNTLYEIYSSAIKSKDFKKLKEKVSGKYYVLIMHRQEHVLFDKENSLELIKKIINSSKLHCVLLTHEISKSMLSEMKEIKDKIIKVDRMPYKEFINLIKKSEYVATDGGSNQEELYYMGKPTLILRRSTERIEGLKSSALLLRKDFRNVEKFVKNYKKFRKNEIGINISPSKIIVDSII